MPKVTLRFGNNELGTWEIYDEQPVTVGRSPDNTIVIDNPGVSRRHCIISKQGNFCIVQDNGSNNGTFHNGKKIDQANLNNGDEIAIGKHIMLFASEALPQAAQPAAPGMPPAPGMAADPMAQPAPQAAAPGEEAAPGMDFGPNTMMIDMEKQVTTGSEKRGHITVKGKGGEQTIMLRKSEYIIGKAPSCDVVIKGMGISKKHAIIIKDLSGFRIVDVSDKKPTLVNGSPIDRTMLNKGDVIKIGKNEFNFYQEG